MAENIKVAVRVRPFNSREEKRGSNLIVQMSGKSTTVVNPANPKADKHTFTYDHSYWSFDGYTKESDGCLKPKGKKYVDQDMVFSDLGVPMLENAWSGYNCSIFAYGQTGSGKSYSIVGHGANAGLVPRTCQKLFLDMEERRSANVHFEVTFSMLEIYNENVRDLLNLSKNTKSLSVRERPDKGFFVDGLTSRTVRSYDDIRLRMSEGEKKRTIAATKMNETSSRAHTIVAINFTQNDLKLKRTKLAAINLVDLAGSERVKQTEAEGDRFKEAKNINQSLLTLGNVLKALCDQASGKRSQNIPYRDSVLTKLLKNALGGNSKTVMIAAIGPDAENYEQTLSTLRYADRAKAIKTKAQVNTAATDKMIQELIAEKERLLQELKDKKGADPVELQRAKEEHENEIRHYKAQMVDMKQAWEEELERVRKEMEEMKEREAQEREEEKRMPHLMNLNEDPALCGKLNHIIQKGTFLLGNGKQDIKPDILLTGPRVVSEHAIIMHKKKVYLEPKKGLVLHNGKELTASVQLHHQDRIQFGSRNLFVFNHPEMAEEMTKKGKVLRDITYEFAQDEIARCQGLLDLDNEDEALREEVMSIMQVVQDVNAMAEELGKEVTFNIVLVSADARCAEDGGRTEVFVRMYDLVTENEYLWDRNKFLVRQSHMQEMYSHLEETGNYPEVEQERDPFWEPPDMDVLIGVVPVPMNYIAHTLAFDEEALQIIDYKAGRIGFLKVEFVPCNMKGVEDDPPVTEDPMDLVGRPLAFKIKIIQALNLPQKYMRSWCRYRFYEEMSYETTQRVASSNPHYEYQRVIKLSKEAVDHKFIDYLNHKSLAIEIWGQQADASAGQPPRKSKRQDEKQKLRDELAQQKRANDSLQAKLDRIAKIIEKGPKSAELKAIKKILKE